MGLHQAALKIRSRILADRLNRFLQLGSNEGITVLINRITILLVILIETFQNGFNLGINVLHTAFVRLDRGQIIVQQLTLNQVEGQNAANPAILHFHILAAFFLDDHVRVHGSYRIEAFGTQHFQINGDTVPRIIKLLIGVIRVDQRGIGDHRIQFLANGRFLPERIHLFGMLHQTGA